MKTTPLKTKQTKKQTQACKLKHKYNISICKVTDKKKNATGYLCVLKVAPAVGPTDV